MLEWMFDRKASPLSFAVAKEFSEEYYAMTDFIWPEAWKDEVSFHSSDKHISLMSCTEPSSRMLLLPNITHEYTN